MSEEVEISKILPVENMTAGYWEITRPEVIDTSTVAYDYIEYREDNVTGSAEKPDLRIQTRDRDSFVFPHDSYCEVRYVVCNDDARTVISDDDVVGLQNNTLSLFKDIEYSIEDQRIEYIKNPAYAWQIRNISTFSGPFGKSCSSNQHYFLDNSDSAAIPKDSVKFYIDMPGTDRHGKEIRFITTVTDVPGGGLTPITTTDPSRWVTGDSLKVMCGINPVIFSVKRAADTVLNTFTPTLVTVNATVLLGISLNGTGGTFADNTPVNITCYGVPITFLVNGSAVAANTILTTGDQTAVRALDGFIYNGLPAPAATAGLSLTAFCSSFNQFNKGFFERYKQVNKYSTGVGTTPKGLVSVWIPLRHMFMFAQSFTTVSRGLRHGLVLNKETNYNQVLLRADRVGANNFGTAANKVVKIDYISWWVPKLRPDPSTLSMLEGALISRQQYPMNFTDLTCLVTQKQQNSNGVQNVIQLSTQSNKIVKCWVAFQLKNRYEGDQSTNKRVFDNMLISSMNVRLNGQTYPFMEYRFDKNNNDFKYFNRAFNDFLNSGHKMGDDLDSSQIDYENYGALYPIFYFDLQYQPPDLYKPIKYSELELRYIPNVVGEHYIIIVYESERQLLIEGVGGSMAIVQ